MVRCIVPFAALAIAMWAPLAAAAQPVAAAAARPFELVRGLYYFTDQGLYRSASSTAGRDRTEFSETIAPGPAVDFHGRLALTFDDVAFGPYLDRLLDQLRARGIRAIFFLTATHMGNTDQGLIARYLRRMLADGHELGNHSWGHDTLDRGRYAPGKDAYAATKAEFAKLEDRVDAILGAHYAMRYVRPPFGIRGNAGEGLGERMSLPGRVDQVCRDMGREMILWHINSLDFLLAYPAGSKERLDSSQAAQACLKRIRASRGGVVLFHANPRTPAMLEEVLDGLAPDVVAGRYAYGTVADLLEMKYGTASAGATAAGK